jgi:pimeloyl-ACP methyl ester carboxylesterase
MNTRTGQLIAILVVILILNSCAFFKLKKEIETMQTMIGVGGEITNRSPKQRPLIVVLYTEVGGKKQINNFKIIEETERVYAFLVPTGEYYIVAFEDANGNLTYDAGEYFGYFGKPEPILISTLKSRNDLHIEVAGTNGFPVGFPADMSMISSVANLKAIATGKITTLDDEKFSEEYAKMGFWQPVTFLKKAGAGVYFLEKYDPAKIPVLFVHGASGSPRHFRFLAENIDRNSFQPWFYHYPSGIPLARVSRFLNHLATYLHDEYRFEQLYVTAHSIGGLVSRSFILRNVYDDGNDYIKLFVTISSPFGGLETAQKGVESAPVAIPSWHDVVPNSPFIGQIFSQPLNSKLDYYLLFSYKGDCSLFMDNNDGSVTLKSQLDLRAQNDSIEKWGFDEGHISILSSPDVLKIYNEILEKTGSAGQYRLNLFGITN